MLVAHVSLFFALIFLVITLLFFSKRQSRLGNRLIGLVMLIIGFQHFMHFIWGAHLAYAYPWLLNIDVPLDGCIAPLLLFYIKEMTGERVTFRWTTLLHFWAVPLGVGWYIYFNLQPRSFQMAFIDKVYTDVPALAAIVNIMIAVYLGIGYRKLDRYIKSQPDTAWTSGYSNMLWLRQFVAIMFFINVGAAPLNLIAKFSYIFVGFPVLTGFMLLFIIYKTFNHPEVMSTEQLRKITQQLEYQKEIEKVRRQISNDIHDELGAGLTQITMLSELEKLKQKSETSSTASFEKISTLSSALMLSLREVVWAMNPVHDNLNSLLAFFRQTVSAFFEPTAIRIQLNISESNDAIAIDPFMRRNLVLIVKEALNNIVKHADASVVSFTCEVEQQQLHISIQDNGKGMPATTSVLGNGIRNIEKRVEAIGGTLVIQTSPDHGVTLNIQVPLNHIT